MKKRILLLSACIVAVLMSSCKKEDKEYDASGVFEITEVVVSAETQGEIIALNFNEGSNVTAGQELGAIDAVQLSMQKNQLVASQKVNNSRKLNVPSQVASLQKNIETQRKQIATQRGQIDVQRQQLSNLQSERSRFAALLADNAGTEKQVSDIDHQVSVLQKQIEAAEKQLAVSETQIAVTESQIAEKREQLTVGNNTLDTQNEVLTSQIGSVDEKISDAIVRSPITGIILQKYAEVGEYAMPGKALFKVGNINDMKIRVYVTAAQLTGLKIGQKVKVYADKGESDRKEYQGTISWISEKAEFTPKTIQTRDERSNLVYAIKINVKNDGLIKSGMYGEVRF